MSVRVSVVIPAYNAEQHIGACFAGLQGQTLADIEILCVNDGSADSTGALIDARAAQDPRIRVLHQANGGVSAARNTGLDMARGEYVAFVDADDHLPPHGLETLWQASQGADVVTADHAIQHEDGSLEALTCPPAPNRREILSALARCDGRYNAVWGKLYRRGFCVAQGLRFPQGIRIGEDVVFNLRAFALAQQWVHVPESLYVYRPHAASAMAGADYAAHVAMLEAMDAFLREGQLKTTHYRDFLELHAGLLAKEGKNRLDAAARRRVNGGVRFTSLPFKQRLLYGAIAVGLDGLAFRRMK
ncbi:MAG: glycosyltransferase [Clostridia bacterium]|nr:glycosyltransferase [Clostridia bacterium]